jgi:hypothetical protein
MAEPITITTQLITDWLSAMGWAWREVPPSPPVNWQFEIQDPGQPQKRLLVQNTKLRPRGVAIGARLDLTPEHQTLFDSLNEAAKRELSRRLLEIHVRRSGDLQFSLNIKSEMELPADIHLSTIRFDDGLTLDSFAHAVWAVDRALVETVVFFQQNLPVVRPASLAGWQPPSSSS